MSYSPKPGLPSSYSTRSTPSASLAARSATPVAAGPTGRFEGRGHRPDRVGPAGFPVHASEGPQRTAPFPLVLPVEPFSQRIGQHLAHEAVGLCFVKLE